MQTGAAPWALCDLLPRLRISGLPHVALAHHPGPVWRNSGAAKRTCIGRLRAADLLDALRVLPALQLAFARNRHVVLHAAIVGPGGEPNTTLTSGASHDPARHRAYA